MKDSFRIVFPKTLPVMAGYLFLGIAYGISMKEAGLPAWATAASSLLIYAGSLQFAMIGLLQGAFAPLTTLLLTLAVNARHLFYSLTMLIPYQKLSHPQREYNIFALTDETFSLVVRQPDHGDAQERFTAISLLDQAYWVTGSVMGAVLGKLITVELTGIDFAMTALFAVIVTEQTADAWREWKQGNMDTWTFLFPTLLGFGATILCLMVFGTGSFLIAAMAVMMAGFYLGYRKEER